MNQDRPVEHGTLLWEPTEESLRRSRLWPYLRWLEDERGLTFADRGVERGHIRIPHLVREAHESLV